jgi:hypothetical protein
MMQHCLHLCRVPPDRIRTKQAWMRLAMRASTIVYVTDQGSTATGWFERGASHRARRIAGPIDIDGTLRGDGQIRQLFTLTKEG